MSIPVLMLVVLWFWFALAVIAAGLLVAAVSEIFDDRDWTSAAAIGLAQLVTLGFMTGTLILLGHPIFALWIWRVLSGVIFATAVTLCIRSLSRPPYRRPTPTGADMWKQFLAFAVTLVAGFFFVCSLLLRSLPVFGGRVYQTSTAASPNMLTQLDFWHTALFVILGVTVLISGLLFVLSTQREGPLSFEKNWGGLGGSTGGWHISSSMTYLTATIFLSGLFLALIVHEENLHQQEEKLHGPATGQATAQGTGQPTAQPAVKPETANAQQPLPSAGKAPAPAPPSTH